MAIHSILRMGDPRLLQMAQPVTDQELGSSALDQLIIDLFDTMPRGSQVMPYARFSRDGPQQGIRNAPARQSRRRSLSPSLHLDPPVYQGTAAAMRR